MTVKDWIQNNYSFYHVTQANNIPDILSGGLLKGENNPHGICVIRSSDSSIIKYLIHMMLFTTDETNFSIIEISPLKHNLRPEEIREDDVVELTNPLHNYIRRRKLQIQVEDVIFEMQIDPLGFTDVKAFEQQLVALNLIQSLEY